MHVNEVLSLLFQVLIQDAYLYRRPTLNSLLQRELPAPHFQQAKPSFQHYFFIMTQPAPLIAAFRLADLIEVTFFNARQEREKIVLQSKIQAAQISRVSIMGQCMPSTIVLDQAFPEHPLGYVSILREEYAWPMAFANSLPLARVETHSLPTVLSNIDLPTSSFPISFTPSDAIALNIVGDIFSRYANDKKEEAGSNLHPEVRALARTLSDPFAGAICGVAPDGDETRMLDGQGLQGHCPGRDFAQKLFSGSYLAWLAPTPQAQLMVWRSAVVDFLDLMSLPTGSLANGFCNRSAVLQVRERGRLQLPEDIAPGYRGEHLCDKLNELKIVAMFEDRVLVQRGRAVHHGEFDLGRERSLILDRLHPEGKTANITVSNKLKFDHLPSFDLIEELDSKGWLSAFRIANKTKQDIVFGPMLNINQVGSTKWEAVIADKGLLDKYTLLVIMVLLFKAKVLGGDKLLMKVTEEVETKEELIIRLPSDGIKPEIAYGSRYLNASMLMT